MNNTAVARMSIVRPHITSLRSVGGRECSCCEAYAWRCAWDLDSVDVPRTSLMRESLARSACARPRVAADLRGQWPTSPIGHRRRTGRSLAALLQIEASIF